MKIAVVGMGYVGVANAVLLAQNNDVIAYDVVKRKVDKLNQNISPIMDEDISFFLNNVELSLIATFDAKLAYENAEYIIIATPTNYDAEKNYFDTSSIEETIKLVRRYNKDGIIVIKSTIPIGYIDTIKSKMDTGRILYCPEFLREGKALYDNLHPSRIVVGGDYKDAQKFANIVMACSKEKKVPIVLTSFKEAEAIKLLANTFLAMRVAYFNEIDTYAEINNLSSSNIITGICLDPRIGNYYNNPSFGYGGYCLPKDTKQLLVNFAKIPSCMMQAIVKANEIRLDYIADVIIKKGPKVVGIYNLAMKTNSDNCRQAAVLGVISRIRDKNINILIYGNQIYEDMCDSFEITSSIKEFKEKSDIILANRNSEELEDVMSKVYCRDIYRRD